MYSVSRGFFVALIPALFLFAATPAALAVSKITVNDVSLDGTSVAGLPSGTQLTFTPSSTILADVKVTLGPGGAWHSTSWRIGDSGSYTCVDTPNENSGTHTHSVNITAPAVTGTYDLSVNAYSGSSCTGVSGAFSAQQVITVAPTDQTITVTTPAPAAANYGDNVEVAATASSGLPVAITSSGSCSGSGTGFATLTMTSGAGTCTVTYSQPGNASYNPAAPVTESVTANPRPITVTANSASKTLGSSDPVFSYALNEPLIGSDTFSGALSRDPGEDAGTYAITQGTLDAGANYAITFVGSTLTILPADPVVAIIEPTSFTYDGAPHAATVQTTPATGFDLTITYNGDPTVPTDAGTYKVFVHASSTDPNYNSGDGIGSITINKATQTIDFAALSDRSISSGDFTVSATASSGLPVTFAASGACLLSGADTVQLEAEGTCTITASQAGDGNYLAASDVIQSFTVTPPAPPATPTISPDGYVFHGNIDNVTITTTDTNVTLHYTTDGSTPDCTSTVYSSPLSFVNTTILSAIACNPAGETSAVATATFSPAGGDGGGSGGSGGGAGGQVLGAAIGPSATTTPPAATTTPVITPIVATSTPCAPLLTSYIKLGAKNDVDQVKALQHFLNLDLSIALPMTGYYGPLSFSAVKQFQEKYADEVIKPWATVGFPFEKGTGYVYKTTVRWVNVLNCGLPSDTTEFPISLP